MMGVAGGHLRRWVLIRDAGKHHIVRNPLTKRNKPAAINMRDQDRFILRNTPNAKLTDDEERDKEVRIATLG